MKSETNEGKGFMKSVYVGNLPYATTDEELKKMFEQFGTVFGARIKTDRDTGRPLGYGFVQMEDADAAKAIEALDGKEMAGRNLRVNESREKSPADHPQRKEFGDRPSRRGSEHRRDFGDRPPRRDFGNRSMHREFGDHPPRKEFGDHPPRREYKNEVQDPRFGSFNPTHAEDYDSELDDDNDFAPREEFDRGGEVRQRRRNFMKKNNKGFHREFNDGDRPRRPFFKQSPRKKGFRPNEDYDSEE